MEQEKIWEVYQNEDGMDVFQGSMPRYKYIANQIRYGLSVLNIGIGRGGLEALLYLKGAIVSSIDPDKRAVEGLKSKFDFGDRIRVGYSSDIPFANGEFDVVVMSEVLEHLESDNIFKTLKEVERILKPGGRFIGTVPANELLKMNIVVCPCCGNTFHRWGHVQEFSRSRIKKLLEDYQFIGLQIQYRAFPDWSRRSPVGVMKSVVRWVLGRFGANIAFPTIYFVAFKRL